MKFPPFSNDPKTTKPGNASSTPDVTTSKDPVQVVADVSAEYKPEPDPDAPYGRTPTGRPKAAPGSRKRRSVATTAIQGEGASDDGARPNAGFTVDKQIVEKTAKTVLTTIDGFVTRKVVKTAALLGADRDLAVELGQSSQLTTSEADLMSELTGVIFEKYGLLSSWAPEALLGIMITEYGFRVTLVLRRLNELARMKTAKDKAASVVIMPPEKNASPP